MAAAASTKPHKMKSKKVFSDYVISVLIFVIMLVVSVTTLYPFLNALALSLNEAQDTTRGGITIYPRVFTLESYKGIFTNPDIWHAYLITILRTVIGTVGGLLVTGSMAFALSRKSLVGRRFYSIFCLIPMYFGGGLIPTYIVTRSLGLVNNFWVYIIPSLVNIWNMILMRSYFSGVPDALEESARIDGANYFTVFFKIFWPVSTPIIATIALYFGVQHWNDWYVPTIYMTSREDLKPMTCVLLRIINEAAYAERMAAQGMSAAAIGQAGMGRKMVSARSITMATLIVSIIPIIVIYPFLQRYFIKGIMIGSIKG